MTDVSVVIPTYNRSHLIGESISSVLSQTYKDFELIVVDDGSEDNTKEVVGAFSDPRLRYYRQPNKGVSAARNHGIRKSHGELVAFLDSDDMMLPERLAVQVARLAEEPDAGLVYGRYISIHYDGASGQRRGRCHDSVTVEKFLFGVIFHWSTVLVRRSWLDQAGYFDEQFTVGEEWELTIRLALAGCRMVCTPQAVTVVRQQEQSLGKSAYKNGPALNALLDKVFADPRLPDEARHQQDLVYAARFIRTAASAYLAKRPETGRRYLERALHRDPSLQDENMELLVDQLVNRIVGLSLDETQEVMKLATTHLPGPAPVATRLRKQMWGKRFELEAFQAYQEGDTKRCRQAALQAISHSPGKLRNRGLRSILIRSLMSNWFMSG